MLELIGTSWFSLDSQIKIATWITATAAAFGVLAIIFTKLSKEYKKAKRFAKNVNRALPRIERIEQEILPNGGNSIKDHVNGMSEQIAFVTATLYAHMAVSGTAAWRSDSEGKTRWVSLQMSLLSGWPETAFIGYNWMNVVHSDDVDRVREDWDECVRDRRTFFCKLRLVKPSGEEVKIIASANPVMVGKKLIGFCGTVVRD